MNKKVFIAALGLVLVFLLIQYILKIFFPDLFLLYVENENLITAGEFIDTHWWLYLPIMLLIGLISDYLYFGAVCRKIKLPVTLLIIMLIYNGALASLYTFAPEFIAQYSNLIVSCSMIYMFIIPLLYTRELVPIAVTYAVTNVAQLLTLSIRDLSTLLTTSNTLTTLLVSLESYLWAALCFVIFNYKRKEDLYNGDGKTVVRQRKVLD